MPPLVKLFCEQIWYNYQRKYSSVFFPMVINMSKMITENKIERNPFTEFLCGDTASTADLLRFPLKSVNFN